MTSPKPAARVDVKTYALDFAKNRWADFRSFSPGQKAVTIVAVGALIIGGLFFMSWSPAPTYAPLYSNLAASDATAIVSKLTTAGIPYKLTDGGAGISVPVAKVAQARLTVSAAGLPNSDQTGYDLIDKEGVTTSQFRQQVDYQRAVEGTLETTIEAISGVQSASVHLAIPQDDVYTDSTEHPTAAVLVTVAQGASLNSSQVQTIVNLVSSSVTGMSASDVTVSDSNGNVLSAPGTGDSTDGISADTQSAETQAYDNRVAAGIQAAVDATLGAGHAKIVVNCDLDFDKSTTKSDSYTYKPGTPPVSATSSSESYGSGTSNGGGTLGTTSASGSSTTGSGGYVKTSSNVTNALGTISNETDTAPGALKDMHIAVVLDKNVKGLNVAALTSLIQAGVGYAPSRGDTLSVQALPFDTSAQTAATSAAAKSAALQAAQQHQAQLVSWIKQGVLGLLIALTAFFVWRSMRKRAKAQAARLSRYDSEFSDSLLGDYDTEESAPEPVVDPVTIARREQKTSQNSNHARVVEAAATRPTEVANLVSDWLHAKER